MSVLLRVSFFFPFFAHRWNYAGPPQVARVLRSLLFYSSSASLSSTKVMVTPCGSSTFRLMESRTELASRFTSALGEVATSRLATTGMVLRPRRVNSVVCISWESSQRCCVPVGRGAGLERTYRPGHRGGRTWW